MNLFRRTASRSCPSRRYVSRPGAAGYASHTAIGIAALLLQVVVPAMTTVMVNPITYGASEGHGHIAHDREEMP